MTDQEYNKRKAAILSKLPPEFVPLISEYAEYLGEPNVKGRDYTIYVTQAFVDDLKGPIKAFEKRIIAVQKASQGY